MTATEKRIIVIQRGGATVVPNDKVAELKKLGAAAAAKEKANG